MNSHAERLIGFWQGRPSIDTGESTDDAPGVEFHVDGLLISLSPVGELDHVDKFLFDADERSVTTWVPALRHRTNTPYRLAPDGTLTIEFADGATHFDRADGPRVRERHQVFQQIDPDVVYHFACTPTDTGMTGREFLRMMEEDDRRICEALGITRTQLRINRDLHWLWAEHTRGRFRSVPVVDYRDLLERGAVTTGFGNQGETLLMLAARRGLTELVDLLVDFGDGVNARDEYGWTALMNAVVGGHAATVRHLLERGADATIPGRYSTEDGEVLETTLDRARREGHHEVARLLEDVLRPLSDNS